MFNKAKSDQKINILDTIQNLLRKDIQQEEKIVLSDLNFVNWIIGVSSGGFILMMSNSKELVQFGLIESLLFIGFFTISILSSTLFHLLSRKQLKFIFQKMTLYEMQYLIVTNNPEIMAEWDFENIKSLLRKMSKFKAFKRDEINDFAETHTKIEGRARLSRILIFSTVISFVSQFAILAYFYIVAAL
ncbi:MAG: hypothetical protein ABJF04_06330 [Reichenbachiella sp.]|uniref:hypothetical protein n=1 Tax=Reichenbachiella sp. TaxID=2184521 RepID=UPI003267DD18